MPNIKPCTKVQPHLQPPDAYPSVPASVQSEALGMLAVAPNSALKSMLTDLERDGVKSDWIAFAPDYAQAEFLAFCINAVKHNLAHDEVRELGNIFAIDGPDRLLN